MPGRGLRENRLRGLEAELEALRAGVAVGDELEAIPRTEAILAALRQADGSLSPTGTVERLHAAGRDDSARAVTATLDHLMKQGRVEKVGRGRYVAGWGRGACLPSQRMPGRAGRAPGAGTPRRDDTTRSHHRRHDQADGSVW